MSDIQKDVSDYSFQEKYSMDINVEAQKMVQEEIDEVMADLDHLRKDAYPLIKQLFLSQALAYPNEEQGYKEANEIEEKIKIKTEKIPEINRKLKRLIEIKKMIENQNLPMVNIIFKTIGPYINSINDPIE